MQSIGFGPPKQIISELTNIALEGNSQQWIKTANAQYGKALEILLDNGYTDAKKDAQLGTFRTTLRTFKDALESDTTLESIDKTQILSSIQSTLDKIRQERPESPNPEMEVKENAEQEIDPYFVRDELNDMLSKISTVLINLQDAIKNGNREKIDELIEEIDSEEIFNKLSLLQRYNESHRPVLAMYSLNAEYLQKARDKLISCKPHLSLIKERKDVDEGIGKIVLNLLGRAISKLRKITFDKMPEFEAEKEKFDPNTYKSQVYKLIRGNEQIQGAALRQAFNTLKGYVEDNAKIHVMGERNEEKIRKCALPINHFLLVQTSPVFTDQERQEKLARLLPNLIKSSNLLLSISFARKEGK